MTTGRIPWWKAYLRVARACRTPFVICIDAWYKPVLLRDVLSHVPVSNYVAEAYDCDEFAFALRVTCGSGVGVCTNLQHVWNVALGEHEVWQVEPQIPAVVKRWALVVLL
jgi:hypothetical protein